MADSSDAIDLGGGSPGLPEPFLVSTPEALRAFAHPLRQRLIHELSILKHARAADLAEVLDEPANAISFHLRALARAGLITEAPEHARDRRDRVWKPVAESYALDRKVPGGPPPSTRCCSGYATRCSTRSPTNPCIASSPRPS